VGSKINSNDLVRGDPELFSRRLQECLLTLENLLGRPDFGAGETTIGAELEVSIIDSQGKPLPINSRVLAERLDERIQPEINQFNLEFNLDPVIARGTPFTAMEQQLASGLEYMNRAANQHGGSVAAIGILPTLTRSDLGREAISDLPRYNLLASSLRSRRQAPFQINIRGEEHLLAVSNTVALEGSNTSLQLHLRVRPVDYANTFNAAQLVTPIALAISGNSPYFLGRRLWDETRIALFKQSVDSRSTAPVAWRRAARVPFGYGWIRSGVLELFSESVLLFEPIIPVCSEQDPMQEIRAGRIPDLSELRLHQGTIWQWNRPIYDPAQGGHLRIELRALPSGPTPVDMAANAAFLIGATTALAPRMPRLLPGMPFQYAEYNFYRSAQDGMRAKLLWPSSTPVSPRERPVGELIMEMLPVAAEGLDMLGVEHTESDRLLDVIRQRCDSGMNAACWQSAKVKAMTGSADREQALRAMLVEYQALALGGKPLHLWPR
jgi:gamma-glutamyl:cysteine ligase YbdK (ATP-grasp superfamily)